MVSLVIIIVHVFMGYCACSANLYKQQMSLSFIIDNRLLYYSNSEDHCSLLLVSLSFILCLSYSLTYFTPLYPVLILTHHYITVTLLLLPLVLYRLSTSEERWTLHSKGRRLPIYVGWVHWST